MKEATVRIASSNDSGILARLKIQWADLSTSPGVDEQEEFASALSRWMDDMGDSLICRIATVAGIDAGMAWLVVYPRVPDVWDRNRLSGDIQSVFVLPEYRGLGVGEALVHSLCDAADVRGISRVTVSSNVPATSLYRRLGFRPSAQLLERRNPNQVTISLDTAG